MAKAKTKTKPKNSKLPPVDTTKPINKMVKRELQARIKELEKSNWEHQKAFISWEAHRKSIESREAKLKEDKQEAIAALEVWKSGCLEAQEAKAVLENRLLTLRNTMELELLQTPLEEVETQEEKDSIVHSLVKKLAKTLISLEGQVRPYIDSFLPIPQLMSIMDEERNKHLHKSKQVRKAHLEDQLAKGFFTQ